MIGDPMGAIEVIGINNKMYIMTKYRHRQTFRRDAHRKRSVRNLPLHPKTNDSPLYPPLFWPHWLLNISKLCLTVWSFVFRPVLVFCLTTRQPGETLSRPRHPQFMSGGPHPQLCVQKPCHSTGTFVHGREPFERLDPEWLCSQGPPKCWWGVGEWRRGRWLLVRAADHPEDCPSVWHGGPGGIEGWGGGCGDSPALPLRTSGGTCVSPCICPEFPRSAGTPAGPGDACGDSAPARSRPTSARWGPSLPRHISGGRLGF